MMLNLHIQEALTNFLTTLVHRKFRRCRKRNDLWWWLNLLVLSECLVSHVAGVEVSQHTLAAHLGHNVTLPCVGSDQVVFQGGHASQLITDGTHFIIQEAAEEDQGTYYCYSNNSVVAKVDLILTENVPLLESNSAQPNDEDNSDSNYLRVLGISTAISIFVLVTLVSGIGLLVKQRSHKKQIQHLKDSPGEDESLELVPNITLNPSFNIDMLEHIETEYNETSGHSDHMLDHIETEYHENSGHSEHARLVSSSVKTES